MTSNSSRTPLPKFEAYQGFTDARTRLNKTSVVRFFETLDWITSSLRIKTIWQANWLNIIIPFECIWSIFQQTNCIFIINFQIHWLQRFQYLFKNILSRTVHPVLWPSFFMTVRNNDRPLLWSSSFMIVRSCDHPVSWPSSFMTFNRPVAYNYLALESSLN